MPLLEEVEEAILCEFPGNPLYGHLELLEGVNVGARNSVFFSDWG